MGTSEIHKYNLKSNIFFGMNTLVVGEMVLRILKIEYLILNIEYRLWDEHDGGGRDGFESGDGWIASGGLSRWFQDLGNTVSPPVLHHQTKCDRCNVEFTNNKVWGCKQKWFQDPFLIFSRILSTPWGPSLGGLPELFKICLKNEESSN